MISEKFKNNAPISFLDEIEKFSILQHVHFLSEYELEEYRNQHEQDLLFVGQFQDIDKKKESTENTEYLQLHLPSEFQEIIRMVQKRMINFLLIKLTDRLNDHFSKKSETEGTQIESTLIHFLRPYFFSPVSHDELIGLLKVENKKLGIKNSGWCQSQLDLIDLEKRVFSSQDTNERKKLFIPVLNKEKVFCISFEKDQADSDAIFLSLFQLLNESATVTDNLFSLDENPLVVLNETLDVFHSNRAFRQLNVELKWLNELKNGELLNKNGLTFLVIILKDLQQFDGLKVVLFLTIKENRNDILSKGNDEELGIICSSIAHELNNPIGGILNAFQLLKVLNDYDEGTLAIMDEMTKSINRAHRLVNLFLGFVKKDITQKESVQLSLTINQAVDLLRGRMIKEGFFIQLEIKESSSDLKSFNESILIIIFYILLNEALTNFARETLVKETTQVDKTLNIQATLNQHDIHLNFNNLQKCNFKEINSHLLKYLLKSQKLYVDESDCEIRLSWDEEEVAWH